MTSYQSLEHTEHVEEAAHAGKTRPALLIAVLAATLAISEQRGKHAEIRVEESSIGATDAWAQYQAKSIRAALSHDLADVVDALHADAPAPPNAKAAALISRLMEDSSHYEHGDGGKDSIAKHAKQLEAERDLSIAETHTYDNAAAALELGIVLATASVITGSMPLFGLAVLMGVAGVVFDVLGVVAPGTGAF
jgi:hypothetical protein